jgi:hypothetical protein
MRKFSSVRESTDQQYPTMMRVVSLDAMLGALLPSLRARSASNPGPAVTLALHAPGGQSRTLELSRAGARASRAAASFPLDAPGTLDLLLGQAPASALLAGAPAAVRERLDVAFPEQHLHFWNSDRI